MTQIDDVVQARPSATRHVAQRWVCARCGYGLKHIPDDAPCPECGSMKAISPQCMRCAYPLGGLPEDGRCPECSLSVAASIAANPRHQPVAWLKRVQLGALLVFLGAVLTVVLSALGGGMSSVGMLAMGVSQPQQAFSPAMFGIQAFGTTIALLCAVVGVWGWWLLTTPQPGFSNRRDPDRTLRRTVRSTIVITLVCVIPPPILFGVGAFLPTGSTATTISVIVIATALGFATQLASVVRFFAGITLVRRFGKRLRDKKIAGRSTLLIWGGAVVYSMMILGMALMLVGAGFLAFSGGLGGGNPGVIGWLMLPIGFLVGVGYLGMIVGFIFYLMLFERLRSQTKQIVRLLEPLGPEGADPYQ